MVFTSYPFLIFFSLFFLLYWFVFNKSLPLQNFFLLIGSYIFYAFASWKFLLIILFISAFNYFLGLKIEASSDKLKPRYVALGLIQGVGGLFLFKYYDFFAISFNQLFSLIGLHFSIKTLNLLAPIGISFFTFKTISYVLDISKGKLKASKDWVAFFTYISFFPTILSGPIDKPNKFLPQLSIQRNFKYADAVEALRQILWGLFKKIVIADNCSSLTDGAFNGYEHLPGSTLLICAILYAFQMYADFSGYSDIAIGISKLLGIKVTKNFDFPFFAQNVAEYWRKWHISLTAWLTEYIFTPLSIKFRDYGKFGMILAIIINLVICGIWHGANWTYILFGFLHGCYFIPLILNGTINKKKKVVKGRILPTFSEFFNIIKTFLLVDIAFILFKANDVKSAIGYYKGIVSKTIFVPPPQDLIPILLCSFFIAIMLIIEWINKDCDFGFASGGLKVGRKINWSIYIVILLSLILFSKDAQQFVYVQF